MLWAQGHDKSHEMIVCLFVWIGPNFVLQPVIPQKAKAIRRSQSLDDNITEEQARQILADVVPNADRSLAITDQNTPITMHSIQEVTEDRPLEQSVMAEINNRDRASSSSSESSSD